MRARRRQRLGFLWPGAATAIRLALLLLFALGGVGAESEAMEPPLREYDVKAALLFNFTRFVEWPARAFAGPSSPVVIGILGPDPFDGMLDRLVRDETCGGRPIVVARFSQVSAVRDCHLLFINASERGRLARITAALRGRPILTVGDFDGFTTGGGMIRLKTGEESKVQLRVNLEAIKAADLVMSAKLLRVAESVNSTKD